MSGVMLWWLRLLGGLGVINLVYRSLAYFFIAFMVFGFFYMVAFPFLFQDVLISKFTWLQCFQVSGLVTITMIYGDFRYIEGIKEVCDD